MNKFSLFAYLFFASILGGFVGVSAYRFSFDDKLTTNLPEDGGNFLRTENTKLPAQNDRIDFKSAAALATPAVVSIKVKGSGLGANAHARMLEEMFREFFGRERGESNTGQETHGSGSGVIISKDGYIVTNQHVIEDAKEIIVVLSDRSEHKAQLVGKDGSTDLAVLKIEKDGLPALKFGNSDNVAVGEWVLAIGNPFELTSTVTAGIVSAKARNIRILQNQDGYSVESFIQTDAAVNPGNSGGALVNAAGELIGINTAIATQTGSFSGYSFAVPANLVQKIVHDFVSFGTVQRAVLGVRIQDLTAETVASSGMKSFNGVFVIYVGKESSAKEAGIKVGDVILALNDTAVRTTSELQEFIARKRPGDKINLSWYRNGQILKGSAKLKNKMDASDLAEAQSLFLPELGAELSSITEAERGKYGTKNGVRIGKISEGKLKNAGVPEGFIITHFDKQTVNSPADIEAIIGNKKGGVLLEGFTPEGERGFFAFGL